MSNAMRKLQTKIGVSPDGSFGPNTARSIASHYGLSPERGAHLMGQASHESGGFKLTRENLSYSVGAMMRVWPSRFPTEESAKPYERNPKALADKVYSGRMGNKEGEGHKWIGRGFLQLTGYENTRKFASDMALPQVLQDPSLLEDEYAFETAMWFFHTNGLYKIADIGVDEEVIRKITKRVNGGTHGIEDRIDQTTKIHTWLMDS
jgi:putative chitinase